MRGLKNELEDVIMGAGGRSNSRSPEENEFPMPEKINRNPNEIVQPTGNFVEYYQVRGLRATGVLLLCFFEITFFFVHIHKALVSSSVSHV